MAARRARSGWEIGGCIFPKHVKNQLSFFCILAKVEAENTRRTMIELEKLYESAGRHLSTKQQDWESFAADFANIFGSGMALYIPSFEGAGLDFLSTDELITTTNPELMQQFFEKHMHRMDHVFDAPANPFEPVRSSDSWSDSEFAKIDVVEQFLLPNNVFYVMALYAVLLNGSLLILFVWRSKPQGDFSNIEKQRLALFMRYLAMFVKDPKPLRLQGPDEELRRFGEKYLLTEAEVRVLSSLLQGQSLRAIAKESDRSYETVRWHVQNLLEKCQVKTQKNLLNEFYGLIRP
jgi:DNA-binding CsgD family transcriptional regulator